MWEEDSTCSEGIEWGRREVLRGLSRGRREESGLTSREAQGIQATRAGHSTGSM